tara:strand:+ start:2762 stop:3184 length:423 start_codon:yes stop_codon:yes gene_type:complete
MTEKFKILAKYIKDLSSETPDVETYIFVKEHISKYNLSIDIKSKALKDKHIEIETILRFEDKEESKKKSHFEMVFATVVKIDDDVTEKKELEKIVLSDIPTKIYPDLEKSFLDLLHNSGYRGVKFDKKIDFESLYKQKFN